MWLTIRGGGVVPTDEMPGQYSLSWGLVELGFDDDAVAVDIALPNWMFGGRKPRWRCRIADLDRVEVAGGSIVLRPLQGRASKFSTPNSERLLPLLDVLERRGVEIVRVSSNWKFGWTG